MLSQHFGLREFLRSEAALRHGIDMTPPDEVVRRLRALCVHVLEPLRAQFDGSLVVTSGYRPASLNRLVGSRDGSQHVTGEAADIDIPGVAPAIVCQAAIDAELPFDQLILEYPPDGWCHVSFSARQRREVLTISRTGTRRGLHAEANGSADTHRGRAA